MFYEMYCVYKCRLCTVKVDFRDLDSVRVFLQEQITVSIWFCAFTFWFLAQNTLVLADLVLMGCAACCATVVVAAESRVPSVIFLGLEPM